MGKEFHFSKGLDAFALPADIVATEYGKNVISIIEKHPEQKNHIHGLKACLTGPFTLSSNIIMDDETLKKNYKPLLFLETRGHLIPDVLEKMADYIARITDAYKQMGFKIVSIDDPFLSQLVGRRKILFHQREFILDIINRAAKNIRDVGSIHVCGVLSPMLRDLLLETNLKYLDHEFRTAPGNFELFDRHQLEAHGKKLAFGAVQSNPVPMEGKPVDSYIEPVDDIVKHLQLAKERFGEGNMLVKPDCGFGGMVAFDRSQFGLGHEIVIRKLKNMTAAIREVFGH
nr:hypothetical protein [Candidatus Sigynarchaeota archaeon]